jgi:hypothetical protein
VDCDIKERQNLFVISPPFKNASNTRRSHSERFQIMLAYNYASLPNEGH